MMSPVMMPEPVIPQPPMQRVHRRETPLTAAELQSARLSERARMEWDEYYITAEEARRIPQEAMSAELLSRIKYSQRDWPENRMSMTAALGPLAGGDGELYLSDRKGVPAADVFWNPPAFLPGEGPA